LEEIQGLERQGQQEKRVIEQLRNQLRNLQESSAGSTLATQTLQTVQSEEDTSKFQLQGARRAIEHLTSDLTTERDALQVIDIALQAAQQTVTTLTQNLTAAQNNTVFANKSIANKDKN